ncbi:MAG: hypothetical protein KJ754_11035 [Bacteroidetes bacterium]|nr:hypothetical protein [Bacteroidota bacterium]MBU1579952.1 hypothetical protein [Bacteroidota bacterium]MBU2466202.1 hypothetical protein [Bacteroidota bacterium]
MWFKKREIDRLIKAKLNGNITAEQEIKLQKILDSSKEEQIRFLQMMEMENQLKASKPPDESVNVTSEVMQKIKNTQSISSERNVLTPLLNPMIIRLAAVLIIGIFLGAAITWMVTTEKLTPGTKSLVGSMTTPANQGVSYSNQNNLIKMIPYQIGDMHYLNFVLDTRSEIKMEVSFQENDLRMIKANYIATGGNESINLYTGSLNFAATGKTSFQIIFEKLHDAPTGLSITAQQDQSQLFTKKISFEK